MISLPIWSSDYSIGSSILTLDNPKDVQEGGPDSIISICKENNIKEIFLCESLPSGFPTAFKNCISNGIKLNFGLKLVLCNNIKEKTPESLITESKINVWASNDEGYHALIKLYSQAATEGFYYRPRIDSETLKYFYEKAKGELSLSIPFYYSFIHQNLMYGYNCLPDLNFTSPGFQIESNSLPFNFLIQEGVTNWIRHNSNFYSFPVKSIYYKERSDFLAFLANKCLHSRTTLDMPNQDHLSSDDFCFEAWKESMNI